MLDREGYVSYLRSRNADAMQIALSLSVIEEFERFLEERKLPFPSADFSELTRFSEHAIAGAADASDRLVAIARYCRFIGNTKGLAHVLTLLGTAGVLESMVERARRILGEEASGLALETLDIPPLGSGGDRYPDAVRRLLERFEEKLSKATCHKILAGNHHQIPLHNFDEDKRTYAKRGIDGYLKWRHESMLESMEECCRNQTLWYEQVITPEVLDFVRANQEIQSGVRVDDTVYVTKIPYRPDMYLIETDPVRKRHHACHCPFVRASILSSAKPIPDTWCYCTGGYEKLPFDVVFGEELDVEVLETVLGGSERCRFAIKLPTSAIPAKAENGAAPASKEES